jgi:uncharacterized membrane protein
MHLMKKLSLYLITGLYVCAGINHFVHPHFYEGILPDYIGEHTLLIYFSGLCEILFGLLMLPVFTRKIAAWLITLMLIVFMWLHIQMLIDYLNTHDRYLWFATLRIPFQFILIWWAYSFTKVQRNSN